MQPCVILNPRPAVIHQRPQQVAVRPRGASQLADLGSDPVQPSDQVDRFLQQHQPVLDLVDPLRVIGDDGEVRVDDRIDDRVPEKVRSALTDQPFRVPQPLSEVVETVARPFLKRQKPAVADEQTDLLEVQPGVDVIAFLPLVDHQPRHADDDVQVFAVLLQFRPLMRVDDVFGGQIVQPETLGQIVDQLRVGESHDVDPRHAIIAGRLGALVDRRVLGAVDLRSVEHGQIDMRLDRPGRGGDRPRGFADLLPTHQSVTDHPPSPPPTRLGGPRSGRLAGAFSGESFGSRSGRGGGGGGQGDRFVRV